MADNVEYTTTNAAGNSWVDSVPSAVSTGYQAQNTTIEAAYNGLDNSYVYYDSATDEIVIPPSGPIDNNGVLVSVKTEIRLTVASAGDWYLRIVPGTTSTVFDIELTSSKGTWSAAKNALYDTSGRRVLNWKVLRTATVSETSAGKLIEPNIQEARLYDTVLYSAIDTRAVTRFTNATVYGDIYDYISPFIPDVDDMLSVSGAMATAIDGSILIISTAERASSTQITIKGVTILSNGNKSTGEITVTSGSTTSIYSSRISFIS